MITYKLKHTWTMLMIVFTLSLMPTLILGHGYHRSDKSKTMALTELANGAQLVMKTYSGNMLLRPVREAVSGEMATVTATAPVSGGGNTRAKNNNRKSNKSHSKVQNVDGRKHSLKLSSDVQLHQGQRSSIKHQQQLPKLQKQGLQHAAGKRSGTKSKSSEKATTCRYAKSSWTDCDSKSNMRTRTLSLKKGDSHCQPTRTIQKKCKKSCRYEKGPWSECNAGQMAREDKLKESEDGSHKNCNLVRVVNKKCSLGTADKPIAGGVRSPKMRKHKEKGQRRASPQA